MAPWSQLTGRLGLLTDGPFVCSLPNLFFKLRLGSGDKNTVHSCSGALVFFFFLFAIFLDMVSLDTMEATCCFVERHPVLPVPDTASYIRGWIQMVLAPNDLFSWNNKYNKYNEYNTTDTFTRFFSLCTPFTLCMLASWIREGVVFLGFLPSSHSITSCPFPYLGSTDAPCSRLGDLAPLPQNGTPIHRVRAHSLTGIQNTSLLTTTLQGISRCGIYHSWKQPSGSS
jgi:hypothetical protein